MFEQMWQDLVFGPLEDKNYFMVGAGIIFAVVSTLLFAPVVLPLWCLGWVVSRLLVRRKA